MVVHNNFSFVLGKNYILRNPKFSVFKSEKKCLFYYRNTQGKIILSEDGFSAKGDCENRITLIKKSAPHEASYARFDGHRSYYFHIKSGDSEYLAGSIIFNTKAERDGAIRDLKKDAQRAPVVDLSQVNSELN